MEVTYSLTKKDYLAFQQFHMRRKKKFLYGFGVLANVFLVVMWVFQTLLLSHRLLLFWHVLGDSPHFLSFLWSLEQRRILLWLVFTLYLVYAFWGSNRLALHRAVPTQDLAQTKTMRLAPEGVGITTPKQQVTVAWKGIREIASDKHCLYLYLTPSNALLVPKRAFAMPEAAAQFEAAARRFQAEAQMFAGGEDVTDVWPPPPSRVGTASLVPINAAREEAPEIAAVSYVTRRADLWRSSLLLIRLRPATLLNLAIPCLFPAAISVYFSHTPALPVFSLAFVVWLLLLGQWLRSVTVGRMPDPKGERPCRSILRPDAFVDVMPEGRSLLPWRDVGAVFMFMGDLHILRKGAAGGSFIPRTAFPTPQDAQAFFDTMRSQWQSAQEEAKPSREVTRV